jgi:hypothetical protein
MLEATKQKDIKERITEFADNNVLPWNYDTLGKHLRTGHRFDVRKGLDELIEDERIQVVSGEGEDRTYVSPEGMTKKPDMVLKTPQPSQSQRPPRYVVAGRYADSQDEIDQICKEEVAKHAADGMFVDEQTTVIRMPDGRMMTFVKGKAFKRPNSVNERLA